MDLSYQHPVAKHFTREAAVVQCYHSVARQKQEPARQSYCHSVFSEPRGFQSLPLRTCLLWLTSRGSRACASPSFDCFRYPRQRLILAHVSRRCTGGVSRSASGVSCDMISTSVGCMKRTMVSFLAFGPGICIHFWSAGMIDWIPHVY